MANPPSKVRSLGWIFQATDATVCFQTPKALFESDEEPLVVFQLLWIRSHQQDQAWKEKYVIVVGFFTFTIKANTPNKSHNVLVGHLTKIQVTQSKQRYLKLHLTNNQNYLLQHLWEPEGSRLF